MSDHKERDPSGDKPDDQRPSGPQSWSRRKALKGMGALGLSGLFGLKACEEAGEGGFTRSSSLPDRPNILFVMTDDHAVNALSCYGSRLMETPNLDRLAAGGMRFNNCYVTNSLCAPSRATILTGKYSHKHGVRENLFGDKAPFDGSQQTFPKLLREAGYHTSVVGKWHLKSDPTGFDYWNVLPGQGSYHDPDMIEMGERQNHEGYVTDIITDLTMERLEQRRQESDQPFCMFSWHKAPHRGWVPEEDHEDMFSGYDLPVPPTFNDDYMNRSSAAGHAYMNISTMPDWRDEQPEGMNELETAHWNYQRYIKNYLRVIKSFDENMGRLLDYLDRSGLAENTIVVYTTDNGFFLGEHGWFDKRFMYEESIRVPLLVRYPGAVRPGSVNDNVVMNLDLAETFLDYAGVEIPGDMQGRSLRPLLREETGGEGIREVIYYHYYEYPGPHDVRPHYGVRSDRYKLIYFYTIDEWELFDLEDDPYELNSVYGAPAYADAQQEMEALLKQAREEYEDDTGEPLPY